MRAIDWGRQDQSVLIRLSALGVFVQDVQEHFRHALSGVYFSLL
jgi:hypothetical protein